MKKVLIVVLMAAVIGGFFYGCRANIDGTELIQPEENGAVTLRFVNSWGGVDSNADALNSILRNFMQKS